MSLISIIVFLLLAGGIVAKERLQGYWAHIAGFLVMVLVLCVWFLPNTVDLFLNFFDLPNQKLSIFNAVIFCLLSFILILPPKVLLRRIYFIEFTTLLTVFLSILYLAGRILPTTGLSTYTIFQGDELMESILSMVTAISIFFVFRLPYESRGVLIRKLLTLFSIFATLFVFIVYASYLSNLFAKPGYNFQVYITIIPIALIIIGIVLSILLLVIIYAFSSLRERTLEYANDVTKGLRQAKAKDEAMLLSIGEGLVATGKDGNVVFVNRAFEELLGWKEEEVQGKLFVNVVSMFDDQGREIEKTKRPIYSILRPANGEKPKAASTSNMYYKRKDGKLFPVAITIAPIMVEDSVIGVIEVFRDITREKEIDKEKTEFVSLASHQLRTPLSSVNWYAEMLLAGDAGKLNKEQKEYLKEIFNGNQRMIALVNDLLNVSRLELGTFTVNPEKIDIVNAVRESIDEQKQDSKRKKITIKTIFPADQSFDIEADPKLLHMIFQNLLSNSIKYTHEGGEVNLSVEKKPEHVLIKISDTGIGIPKNQQGKIFTKLFRADNVKEEDAEGTGLGLYIIKSIIEASDGTIRFESEEGKGTTFFITLPIQGMKKKEGTRELS